MSEYYASTAKYDGRLVGTRGGGQIADIRFPGNLTLSTAPPRAVARPCRRFAWPPQAPSVRVHLSTSPYSQARVIYREARGPSEERGASWSDRGTVVPGSPDRGKIANRGHLQHGDMARGARGTNILEFVKKQLPARQEEDEPGGMICQAPFGRESAIRYGRSSSGRGQPLPDRRGVRDRSGFITRARGCPRQVTFSLSLVSGSPLKSRQELGVGHENKVHVLAQHPFAP